jgi:tRNA (cytidine/uridine-2'-O-)-methyltransferase
VFHIVLFEPEIPPNTGNIIRLCANSGSKLHLIHPLGFKLDDKRLRRAGLDYHEWADVGEYDSLDGFLTQVKPRNLFACTTKGQCNYAAVSYAPGDALLFGPESRGLPTEVLESLDSQQRIRIPMKPESRSLNLSNAVALILYEAWRQCDYSGGE